MGDSTKATGDLSTAMGFKTEASGLYSISMGNSTKALGMLAPLWEETQLQNLMRRPQ